MVYVEQLKVRVPTKFEGKRLKIGFVRKERLVKISSARNTDIFLANGRGGLAYP